MKFQVWRVRNMNTDPEMVAGFVSVDGATIYAMQLAEDNPRYLFLLSEDGQHTHRYRYSKKDGQVLMSLEGVGRSYSKAKWDAWRDEQSATSESSEARVSRSFDAGAKWILGRIHKGAEEEKELLEYGGDATVKAIFWNSFEDIIEGLEEEMKEGD